MVAISFSTSVRTFWSRPSVSPLRWSSNTEYGSSSECRMPSEYSCGAQPLRDDVDVVVLEVLGHARDERDADRGGEQQADASEELARRVFLEPRRVLVDDVAEDQRIEQREDLIDGGERERQRDQAAIVAQIAEKDFHGFTCIILQARRASVEPQADRAADPHRIPSTNTESPNSCVR